MTRYEHAGAAATAQLTGPIDSDTMALTIDDPTGWPTGSVGPFWIVIDPGTASEEKLLIATRVTNTLNVASGGRGGDQTVAVPHNPPAVVRHVLSAIEVDEANAHVNATTGIHGVTGELAGRTAVQTIVGKTMSGAGAPSANTFQNIPQSAITSLVDRLDVPYWRGYKATPNTINPGVSGSPGTLTTLTSNGITTPSGAHSTAKRVPKAGLYLVSYRVRYGTLAGFVELGDFRLRLGLNPPDDGVDPLDSGTVVAEAQSRHGRSGKLIAVRSSSIGISSGVLSETYDPVSLGTTLPVVPDYVGVNLYSGDGTASGWNVRTDNYTTTNFRLIIDRHVATAESLSCPIRIFAIYGGTNATAGYSVSLSQVLDLNEDDIILFRVWNNGTEQPVEIHSGAEYSQASIVWLGPTP